MAWYDDLYTWFRPKPPKLPAPLPTTRVVEVMVPVGAHGVLRFDDGTAFEAGASEIGKLLFTIPYSASGGADLSLMLTGYAPWLAHVALDPILHEPVFMTPAAVVPDPQPASSWTPTRAQVLDIQCDLMIWVPEVKPNPDANGWDSELQIQLNGDIGRAHGIEAGWVWCTTIGNYPAEKRQIIYNRCKELGHTHFVLHVPGMGPGGGYHNVFPFSQAMSDAYGHTMQTVFSELMAHRLIPVCAGVAPGAAPAPGFDVSRVRCAMTDWDNSAEAATRVRAISDAFPNALLFFELAAGNVHPDPSADDPIAPSAGSNPWIRGMLQKFPRFAGVVHEADISASIDAVVASYTAKHAWWHDLLENQGEVDTFDKFWKNMDPGVARLRNDDIARRCPWLKGTMSGWSMRSAPPDEAPPEHVPTSGDAIDPSIIAVDGGPADLMQWPATATITLLSLRATGIHVEFTKHFGDGSWPDVRPAGWAGDLQYSLGVVLHVNGQWITAAPIQVWRDAEEKGGPIMAQTVNGSAPGQLPQNWFYKPDVWPRLHGYQPKSGEQVGFFVAAGDIRGGNFTVRERSNIVAFELPADGTEKTFTY